ncbi:MAG: DUF1302 family protein [Candidatus Binatia bacterium]
MRTRAGWLGVLAVLLCAPSTFGYYLDSGRHFDVRVRAYAQLGILTEDSETPTWDGLAGCATNAQLAKARAITDPAQRQQRLAQLTAGCPPEYSTGDLGQQRNFYNPEFDANLTDFMKWMDGVGGLRFFTPDDLKFRFAWWGFYDGLYDYLNGPWDEHRRTYKTRFSQTDNPATRSKFFNDENKNPRHIYASRNRINELYMDYSHGPVFVRVGRQAISWGEADTIALLDVSNPFDLTLGAPGFFQDVDEARIPLYTLRTTVKLLDNWKALSSLFLDTYLVPGPIDTTVPINPITAGISPFNPDVADPQLSLIAQGQGSSLHTLVVDRLPENTWGNSRWGARLTGVLLRDYTVQGWFFRTFNQAPSPVLLNQSGILLFSQGVTTQVDDRGFRTPVCKKGVTPAGRPCGERAPVVTVLNRALESVVGLAATWFSEPVNGILKAEAELFLGEQAFLPKQNLNPRVQIPGPLRQLIGDNKKYSNAGATANYLRWVIGYDRNFFFRPLNPSNSFILVMSYNSSFNISETGDKDYRTPNAKPGHPNVRNGPIPGTTCQGTASLSNPLCVQIDPHDYEDAYRYEGFMTATVRTEYLHGKLTPQLTVIAGLPGYYAVAPAATYRVTDNLLLSATYLAIVAPDYKAGLGTFRAHDMVQLRMTVQLN